ncbi:hypothetical protein C8D90_10398 [Enterobacillus tribolii]|uniref:Uncharacterized protein n=1 Tax=Enterobacillus tribolii TaxID=1487935 RepID=A0A370QTZ0_9GAMM|nr:hypothetical protein C8D90_10398 [Enterobacillus tribolii]
MVEGTNRHSSPAAAREGNGDEYLDTILSIVSFSMTY